MSSSRLSNGVSGLYSELRKVADSGVCSAAGLAVRGRRFGLSLLFVVEWVPIAADVACSVKERVVDVGVVSWEGDGRGMVMVDVDAMIRYSGVFVHFLLPVKSIS